MIEISIEAGDWQAQFPTLDALADKVITTAWTSLSQQRKAHLSLLFTDDAHQQILNRNWRGKDKSTNVLSFPGPDPIEGPTEAGPWLLGDISIAFETLMAEAKRDSITPQDHLSHLLVHGLLHLLGHDHETDDEAAAMEAIEVSILAKLGIANPYHASCGPGA